ncbi:MAG: ATP-dependent DNA ligase [Actinobacteria bacterium]|nr:ATP-dependent DNA ligase [Actinomycetota bacterium]
MLLFDVVTASNSVAATSKRTEKRTILAELLRRSSPEEIPVVVGFLTGEVRQGRIGVGWATLRDVEFEHADAPTVSVLEVDEAIAEIAMTTGPGSMAERERLLGKLFGATTRLESEFLTALLGGELRHGALEGVMVDAIAAAAAVRVALVRRAHMLGGLLGDTAVLALVQGQIALADVRLEVLRPIHPMLASTAADVAEAMAVGHGPGRSETERVEEFAIEWKIDGVRVQLHRRGDQVLIVTRNLNDVTERLPGLVDLALSLGANTFILDGEVVGEGSVADEPAAFQDTASRFSDSQGTGGLVPWFFDILHLEGVDLLDKPWTERRAALTGLVGDLAVPVLVTNDVGEAAKFSAATVAAGHEGVMVKGVGTFYEAGRRGKTWRKVKPVITLDLIVVGAEWGHGRRTGRLSNLHLGARDPEGGPPIMVGKTFKGLTDVLLEWQTEALLERQTATDGHVVYVRPELVVEIAIDGVQTSKRYDGGAALRFARVRGYRPDKTVAEADTIDTIRGLRK